MKPRAGQFLSVNGRDFTYGGEKVFFPFLEHAITSITFSFALSTFVLSHQPKVYLSGTNTAWISYGYDFGNNAWADHGDQWIAELDRVLTT